MKKIMFLLAMLPLMMFTSCSSDDNEKELTPEEIYKEDKIWIEQNIVGKWEMTHAYNSISGVWGDAAFGDKICTYEFKSDGTVHITNNPYGKDENTTYKIFINDMLRLNIGNDNPSVFSIEKSTHSMTLYDYGKFRKLAGN